LPPRARRFRTDSSESSGGGRPVGVIAPAVVFDGEIDNNPASGGVATAATQKSEQDQFLAGG
jgi:hypothetical protein